MKPSMKDRINKWVNAKLDSDNFTDNLQLILAGCLAIGIFVVAFVTILTTLFPDGSPCPSGTREQLQVVGMQNNLPVYEVIGCIER